jgi:ABC-type sugar transport system substrate-binding protein
VPFIAMDRAPADQVNISYQVTGDPVADGKLAAQQMIDSSKDLKVLHLLGALTDQNAVGRRDGFKEALKAQSKVQIVAEVPTEWDPAKALDGVSNALQKNPDINAIFAPSDYLLPAVESALKSAGRDAKVGEAGHVFLITIDGDPNGCKAMAGKSIDADIATDIATFGAQAVKAAHTAAAGGTMNPKIEELAGLPLTQANLADTKAKVWGCQK